MIEYEDETPLSPDQLKQGVAIVLARGDAALPSLVHDLVQDMLDQLCGMDKSDH